MNPVPTVADSLDVQSRGTLNAQADGKLDIRAPGFDTTGNLTPTAGGTIVVESGLSITFDQGRRFGLRFGHGKG